MRILILAACLLLAHPSDVFAETLVGRASVIDGDTIEIQGRRIRFHGIDAAESAQTCQDSTGAEYRCGQIAALALDSILAAARPTRCELTGQRHRDRWIGTCFTAKGQSVSAWLVQSGYALDWPRYSAGRYSADQMLARGARVGLWAGGFLEPWNWRLSKAGVP